MEVDAPYAEDEDDEPSSQLKELVLEVDVPYAEDLDSPAENFFFPSIALLGPSSEEEKLLDPEEDEESSIEEEIVSSLWPWLFSRIFFIHSRNSGESSDFGRERNSLIHSNSVFEMRTGLFRYSSSRLCFRLSSDCAMLSFVKDEIELLAKTANEDCFEETEESLLILARLLLGFSRGSRLLGRLLLGLTTTEGGLGAGGGSITWSSAII